MKLPPSLVSYKHLGDTLHVILACWIVKKDRYHLIYQGLVMAALDRACAVPMP